MNIEFNMVRVADQSERYSDMVGFLKEIVQESSGDVSSDVRNLLSVGFKNPISSQRSAWKIVQHEKLMPFASSIFAFSLLDEKIPTND